MANVRNPRDLAVVNCGELITMCGPDRPRVGSELSELGILRNASMLVRDGRIVAIGTYSEIKPQIYSSTEVLDAKGCVVTPGLVDAHTHLVFAGNRANEFEQRIAGATYQEIAAAGGGIQSTVSKTRAATDDELLASARTRLGWMLRSGTTTLEAKSGYGLTLEDELKCLRVLQRLDEEGPQRIVSSCLAAHTVPREFRENRRGYIDLVIREILPAVKKEELAEYCDAFCDEHAFTLSETREILSAAKALGFKLRLHAEQFHADGAAILAAELGAITADHLEATQPSSFAAMRDAGVQPCLVPASVFCIGSTKYPDARGMIAAGLAPVLATDFNPGSSPTTSLPFVMSLACLQMKMSPAEALSCCTANAAHSLGLGTQVGSLDVGMSADFCVWPYSDYREIAYFVANKTGVRVWAGGKLAN